jgi:predicted molibdopterin-dependent oxidoreductase YjgC
MDFIVVQDMFLNETAEIADVVLPACSFVEKDGSFTTAARLVQKVRKIIEPLGESRPDWKILCDLGGRMGYAMNYDSPQDIMEEIASLTPAYGGISYERLESGGLRAPCPAADHPGTEFLWEKAFKTKNGKGNFFPADYQPPAEETDEEYPFVFTTGKDLYHLHTGSYTHKSAVLSKLSPEDLLEISPSDAEKLGIGDGERIKVISRRGRIELLATLTDKVPEGTVFSTFHSSEVNILTTDSLDPQAKVPELKMCAVKIEKI